MLPILFANNYLFLISIFCKKYHCYDVFPITILNLVIYFFYIIYHLKVTYKLRTARTLASLFTQLCQCKSVSPAILRLSLGRHCVTRA